MYMYSHVCICSSLQNGSLIVVMPQPAGGRIEAEELKLAVPSRDSENVMITVALNSGDSLHFVSEPINGMLD